jgi:predicted small lipoprotein YifL
MRFFLIAAALVALTLAGCGRPGQALPETEKEAYEKIISGQSLECEHGYDANGNCLKEGADARPYGGTSKPGH